MSDIHVISIVIAPTRYVRISNKYPAVSTSVVVGHPLSECSARASHDRERLQILTGQRWFTAESDHLGNHIGISTKARATAYA